MARFAGSDTTAITLRAIFYYLMKNPEMLNQLVQEIREFESQGELSDIVTYAESQRMSYLQACIKEAMRLHPAVGFLLERVVPDEGANISGTYFPSGTVVGVNPWVVGREQAVYGSDADDFRPERWLEASKDTLKLMERNWLAVSGFCSFDLSLTLTDNKSLVKGHGPVWERTYL